MKYTLAAASRMPFPAGASVHKFGGLGYVGFAEEVRAQEAQMGLHFDYIIVCTVTGSTHAGMLVGFVPDGRTRNVIGIDASGTPAQTKDQVLDIARNTATLVGVRTSPVTTSCCSRTMPILITACHRTRPWKRSGSPRGSKA